MHRDSWSLGYWLIWKWSIDGNYTRENHWGWNGWIIGEIIWTTAMQTFYKKKQPIIF